MHPWLCAVLISVAGAAGGFVSAVISENGFALPRRIEGVWCPGAVSTIIAGAFAAFASWAFYGAGAGINAADSEVKVSLQFSALAGAFLIGVVGAKWITNEADKKLLKESVKVAATKSMPPEKASELVSASPIAVLKTVAGV